MAVITSTRPCGPGCNPGTTLRFLRRRRVFGAEIAIAQRCEFDGRAELLQPSQPGHDVLTQLVRRSVVEQLPVDAGLALGVGRCGDELVGQREAHEPTDIGLTGALPEPRVELAGKSDERVERGRFAMASRLATRSGGCPRRIFFTGTSIFFPESVRGTSRIAKTSSGTYRGESLARIASKSRERRLSGTAASPSRRTMNRVRHDGRPGTQGRLPASRAPRGTPPLPGRSRWFPCGARDD